MNKENANKLWELIQETGDYLQFIKNKSYKDSLIYLKKSIIKR